MMRQQATVGLLCTDCTAPPCEGRGANPQPPGHSGGGGGRPLPGLSLFQAPTPQSEKDRGCGVSSLLIKNNSVAWLQPVELRRGQGGGSGASMSAWCQLPHLILEWLAKEPESIRLCGGKDSLALCQQSKTKDIQETQSLGETSHTHPRAGSRLRLREADL